MGSQFGGAASFRRVLDGGIATPYQPILANSLRLALEGASREQHQQHERRAFHHGSAICWIRSTTLVISRCAGECDSEQGFGS
jgi:hypothetical protein